MHCCWCLWLSLIQLIGFSDRREIVAIWEIKKIFHTPCLENRAVFFRDTLMHSHNMFLLVAATCVVSDTVFTLPSRLVSTYPYLSAPSPVQLSLINFSNRSCVRLRSLNGPVHLLSWWRWGEVRIRFCFWEVRKYFPGVRLTRFPYSICTILPNSLRM